MRYAAAYMLAVLGGNANPTVETITEILASVGVDCDAKRAKQVVDACQGKTVDELVAAGMEKISTLSAVGGSVASATDAAAPAPAAAAEEKKPAAKEDPKKQEKDDSSDEDGDMVSSYLFMCTF